jgi:hypothetical protein
LKIDTNIFKNRNILIVTKHKKERVIAPLLEEKLGLKCYVTKKFDTDSLGTFCGEIPRKSDPLSTLRQKCKLAMEFEGFELAIATEGSFGNHPSVFFAAANDELIMFYDKKNNIEIIERVLTLETNFNEAHIKSRDELMQFLNKVQFPSHGVILKDLKEHPKKIAKGISSWDELEKQYELFSNQNKSFFIETDMRAMQNPTRMKIIEEACIKLINKIKSCCPDCNYPGFGIVNSEMGLPCSWCSSSTRSTLAFIHKCNQCGFEKRELFPHGKEKEDPMYCDFCNP